MLGGSASLSRSPTSDVWAQFIALCGSARSLLGPFSAVKCILSDDNQRASKLVGDVRSYLLEVHADPTSADILLEALAGQERAAGCGYTWTTVLAGQLLLQLQNVMHTDGLTALDALAGLKQAAEICNQVSAACGVSMDILADMHSQQQLRLFWDSLESVKLLDGNGKQGVTYMPCAPCAPCERSGDEPPALHPLTHGDSRDGSLAPLQPHGASWYGSLAPLQPHAASQDGSLAPLQPHGASRDDSLAPFQPHGTNGDARLAPLQAEEAKKKLINPVAVAQADPAKTVDDEFSWFFDDEGSHDDEGAVEAPSDAELSQIKLVDADTCRVTTAALLADLENTRGGAFPRTLCGKGGGRDSDLEDPQGQPEESSSVPPMDKNQGDPESTEGGAFPRTLSDKGGGRDSDLVQGQPEESSSVPPMDENQNDPECTQGGKLSQTLSGKGGGRDLVQGQLEESSSVPPMVENQAETFAGAGALCTARLVEKVESSTLPLGASGHNLPLSGAARMLAAAGLAMQPERGLEMKLAVALLQELLFGQETRSPSSGLIALTTTSYTQPGLLSNHQITATSGSIASTTSCYTQPDLLSSYQTQGTPLAASPVPGSSGKDQFTVQSRAQQRSLSSCPMACINVNKIILDTVYRSCKRMSRPKQYRSASAQGPSHQRIDGAAQGLGNQRGALARGPSHQRIDGAAQGLGNQWGASAQGRSHQQPKGAVPLRTTDLRERCSKIWGQGQGLQQTEGTAPLTSPLTATDLRECCSKISWRSHVLVHSRLGLSSDSSAVFRGVGLPLDASAAAAVPWWTSKPQGSCQAVFVEGTALHSVDGADGQGSIVLLDSTAASARRVLEATDTEQAAVVAEAIGWLGDHNIGMLVCSGHAPAWLSARVQEAGVLVIGSVGVPALRAAALQCGVHPLPPQPWDCSPPRTAKDALGHQAAMALRNRADKLHRPSRCCSCGPCSTGDVAAQPGVYSRCCQHYSRCCQHYSCCCQHYNPVCTASITWQLLQVGRDPSVSVSTFAPGATGKPDQASGGQIHEDIRISERQRGTWDKAPPRQAGRGFSRKEHDKRQAMHEADSKQLLLVIRPQLHQPDSEDLQGDTATMSAPITCVDWVVPPELRRHISAASASSTGGDVDPNQAISPVSLLLHAPIEALLEISASSVERNFNRLLSVLSSGEALPGCGVYELSCALSLERAATQLTRQQSVSSGTQSGNVAPAGLVASMHALNMQLAEDRLGFQAAAIRAVGQALEDVVCITLQNSGCGYVDAMARIASAKASLANCRPPAEYASQRVIPILVPEALQAQRILQPTVVHPPCDSATSSTQSVVTPQHDEARLGGAQAVQMGSMKAGGGVFACGQYGRMGGLEARGGEFAYGQYGRMGSMESGGSGSADGQYRRMGSMEDGGGASAVGQYGRMGSMEAGGGAPGERIDVQSRSLIRSGAHPPFCVFLADDRRSRAAGLRACVSMLQLLLQSDQRIVNHM